VNATTLPGADLVPPTDPANLVGVAVSGTRIDLTWTGSADTGGSGLAGYEIWRGSTPINTSAVASYSDTTVTNATPYTYKVRAYDGAIPTHNFSGFSNQISITTPDTERPGAPGAPTPSQINGGNLTATWTAASDNVGVTGYRYRLSSDGTNWTSWTDVGNVLSANLTGLLVSTPYTMQVQARDAVDWSTSTGSGGFTTGAFFTDNLTLTGGEVPPTSGTGSTGYVPPIGSLSGGGAVSGGKTINSFYASYQYVCVGPSQCQFRGGPAFLDSFRGRDKWSPAV